MLPKSNELDMSFQHFLTDLQNGISLHSFSFKDGLIGTRGKLLAVLDEFEVGYIIVCTHLVWEVTQVDMLV